MSGLPLAKPSRTARKKKQIKDRSDRRKNESTIKQLVRVRDRHRCRFPLCGCKALKLRTEVSHDKHKGMGGNPTGDRSTMHGMILLCVHRHKDGIISRDKGTLRIRHLTDVGDNGPVAFDVDIDTLIAHDVVLHPLEGDWMEVAREKAIGELIQPEQWQRNLLLALAKMDL